MERMMDGAVIERAEAMQVALRRHVFSCSTCCADADAVANGSFCLVGEAMVGATVEAQHSAFWIHSDDADDALLQHLAAMGQDDPGYHRHVVVMDLWYLLYHRH